MTGVLRYACERCEAEVHVPLDGSSAVCPGCGHRRDLHPGAVAPERVRCCPLCGCEELYLTREFPRGVGLAIVGTAAVVSFVVYGRTDSPLLALLPLGAATLADALLYRLTPPLVVCYLCQAFLEAVPTVGLFPFDAPKALQYEFRRDKMKG